MLKRLKSFLKITKNGVYKKYWDNGQLSEKSTYEYGVLDGLHETYWPNGWLKKRAFFKNGNLNGPFELYNKNGHLSLKCTYKDGKLDGSYEAYYDNGQLYIKSTYKDGKLNGPCEEYWSNGKPLKKCAYKDDNLDGIFEEYWTSNGKPFKKCTYKDGNLEGPYVMYGEGGVIVKRGTYINGEFKEGEAHYKKSQKWENIKQARAKTVELLETIKKMKITGLQRKMLHRKFVGEYRDKIKHLTPAEKRALKTRKTTER